MKAPPEKKCGWLRPPRACIPCIRPNGFEDDAGADGQYDTGYGAGEKGAEIVAGEGQRPAEVGFCERAEDHGEQHGRLGEPRLEHQVAKQPEGGHYADVERGVVGRKTAYGAQREHDGHEDRGRHEDDLAEDAHGDEPDHKDKDVGDEEAREDAVDRGAVLLKKQRAGRQALDHQRAEQDGGEHVAGDAQRHQGDERPAGHTVVGTFRRGHAFQRPLAERFGMLREALGFAVGDEGRGAGPRSRDDADERAEERGTQQVELVRPDFPERQPLIGQLALLDDPALAEEDILKGQEHLRYREKPDERGHQRDAVEQFRHIERVAEIAGNRIDPHR